MLENDLMTEAQRLMTVCNACRYCEGLCAVFPAMEMRRSFSPGDLRYLANLCHSCGACYVDCQFSPPHEFDVNVPKVLAQLRAESYGRYAWPGALAGLFRRSGLVAALAGLAATAAFLVGLFPHLADRRFYDMVSHTTLVALFGAAFGFAVVALALAANACRRDFADGRPSLRSLWQAMGDVARLRYLDGGGAGCFNADERPDDNRRIFHHLTFYGFLLCFAATAIGTLYHFLLQREPPFPWYDLPVLLGTAGGLGLVIGPIGLIVAKFRRDPALEDPTRFGGDMAFPVLLLLTSLTGLALLALRATPAMGVLLAVHLGVVTALFLTMPYGKFVHGIYRFLALLRYARERLSLDTREME